MRWGFEKSHPSTPICRTPRVRRNGPEGYDFFIASEQKGMNNC